MAHHFITTAAAGIFLVWYVINTAKVDYQNELFLFNFYSITFVLFSGLKGTHIGSFEISL